MTISRRAALAALLSQGCRVRHTALERACRYLWNRQADDGGWHSTTYGLLRSGQSLTPFVLDALLLAGGAAPAGRVERALGFLNRNTNPEGAVGKMDPLLYDYPNYATALTVLALRRANRPVAPLAAWLRTQQLSEDHGWKKDDAGYGAWGIGGEPRVAPYPGHVDLSMTRHVLQALAAAEVPPDDPAFTRARVFVERCQNPDGGFFFSTVVLDANKAGQDGEQYRSYGTATADGLLSLAAMKTDPACDRVKSARRWLESHDRPDGASGLTASARDRWTAGLRFYYAAAASEALGRRSESRAANLMADQRQDGSWRNVETLVKEDDPLIATAFAIRAL